MCAGPVESISYDVLNPPEGSMTSHTTSVMIAHTYHDSIDWVDKKLRTVMTRTVKLPSWILFWISAEVPTFGRCHLRIFK